MLLLFAALLLGIFLPIGLIDVLVLNDGWSFGILVFGVGLLAWHSINRWYLAHQRRAILDGRGGVRRTDAVRELDRQPNSDDERYAVDYSVVLDNGLAYRYTHLAQNRPKLRRMSVVLGDLIAPHAITSSAQLDDAALCARAHRLPEFEDLAQWPGEQLAPFHGTADERRAWASKHRPRLRGVTHAVLALLVFALAAGVTGWLLKNDTIVALDRLFPRAELAHRFGVEPDESAPGASGVEAAGETYPQLAPFEDEDLSQILDEFATMSGTTEAAQVVLHPTSARAVQPLVPGGDKWDEYSYHPSLGFVADGPATIQPDADVGRFALTDIDPGLVTELIERAPVDLEQREWTTSHVIIDVWEFGAFAGQVTIRVYAGDDYGSGYALYNLDGDLVPR